MVICMNQEFYAGNRQKVYTQMKPNSLLVLFSGIEVRNTNDEVDPVDPPRDFLSILT